MAGRHYFHFSNGVLFLLLLGAGFVLLLLPGASTQKINFLFSETFEPLLRIGRKFQFENVPMASLDEEFVSRQEHHKLWKNYKNLHAQLLKLQDNYEAIARIRSGLPRFYSGLVLAEVTGAGSGMSHELLINKGTVDGVQQGNYVLSPGQNSIIGIVRDTSEQMARVRLLTDINQNLEIRIRRNGTDQDIAGQMFGNGKRACIISWIEREKDVRPGDAVYAAARPGMLDIPMIIGEVVNVQPDEESPLLWKIIVQPSENTSTLSAVAVIVPDSVEAQRR